MESAAPMSNSCCIRYIITNMSWYLADFYIKRKTVNGGTTVQEVRTAIEDELLSGNSIYFAYDRSRFIYERN